MRSGSPPPIAVRRSRGAFLALAVLAVTPACANLDGLADADGTAGQAKGGSTVASRKTCASAVVKVRDGFDNRKSPDANGWKKGRVSDALPSIGKPDAESTAVLTSRVAATTNNDAKYTSYVEREIPATGCVAAEFMVEFTELAPFPDDAWTYFFWIDAGADGANISAFRMGNAVRLALQHGGSEISRVDIDIPPHVWTKINVELELSLARPSVSIRVDDGAAQHMEVTEPLAPPYFVSLGTWSRGAVPAHEFSFDDVKLSY